MACTPEGLRSQFTRVSARKGTMAKRKKSGQSTCGECGSVARYHILTPQLKKNALCLTCAVAQEQVGVAVCERKMWSSENKLLQDTIADDQEREDRVRQACLANVKEKPYSQRFQLKRIKTD